MTINNLQHLQNIMIFQQNLNNNKVLLVMALKCLRWWIIQNTWKTCNVIACIKIIYQTKPGPFFNQIQILWSFKELFCKGMYYLLASAHTHAVWCRQLNHLVKIRTPLFCLTPRSIVNWSTKESIHIIDNIIYIATRT